MPTSRPRPLTIWGLQDGDRVRFASKTNPTGEVDLRDGTKTKVGEVELIEAIRPGGVAVSWHYGHWNSYGASAKIVVDGVRIRRDLRRCQGNQSVSAKA